MTYTLYSEFSLINCNSLPVLTVMYVHILKAHKSSISFGAHRFPTPPFRNHTAFSRQQSSPFMQEPAPPQQQQVHTVTKWRSAHQTGSSTTITSNFSEPFSLYNTERISHIKM